MGIMTPNEIENIVNEFYERIGKSMNIALRVNENGLTFFPYREENNMKYEIRIDQPGRYGTETIKGEFDNGSEAEAFVETVLEHFQNVTAEITAVASNMPEEEGTDE